MDVATTMNNFRVDPMVNITEQLIGALVSPGGSGRPSRTLSERLLGQNHLRILREAESDLSKSALQHRLPYRLKEEQWANIMADLSGLVGWDAADASITYVDQRAQEIVESFALFRSGLQDFLFLSRTSNSLATVPWGITVARVGLDGIPPAEELVKKDLVEGVPPEQIGVLQPVFMRSFETGRASLESLTRGLPVDESLENGLQRLREGATHLSDVRSWEGKHYLLFHAERIHQGIRPSSQAPDLEPVEE